MIPIQQQPDASQYAADLKQFFHRQHTACVRAGQGIVYFLQIGKGWRAEPGGQDISILRVFDQCLHAGEIRAGRKFGRLLFSGVADAAVLQHLQNLVQLQGYQIFAICHNQSYLSMSGACGVGDSGLL